MQPKGPPILYRLSWILDSISETRYYSDLKYLNAKLKKLQITGARVSVEQCEPNWVVITEQLLKAS